LNPPFTVAVSEIEPPRVTPADAWVAMVGAAWVTTTASAGSLHAVVTGARPGCWYSATHR
jgi:hypothetical protein